MPFTQPSQKDGHAQPAMVRTEKELIRYGGLRAEQPSVEMERAKEQRRSFTILQWNVWFKESAGNILQTLKDVDADILCLQELTTTSVHNPDIDIPALISQELGFQSSFRAAHSWEGGGERRVMGNGIFTRFPIANERSIPVRNMNEDKDDRYAENRLYVEADIAIGRDILTCGTVHLSYVHTPHSHIEFERLLAHVRTQKRRYMLTGDLNAHPTSYAIQTLNETLVHAGPDIDVHTWTTKPYREKDFAETELRHRLDYGFTTPDVHILKAEVVQTTASDHLPLLFTAELTDFRI